MTHYRENRGLDFDAIAAFEARQDAREARQLARLSAEGHTHSVCPRCGDVRTLSWGGGVCNNYDAYTEDHLCGGVYGVAKAGES